MTEEQAIDKIIKINQCATLLAELAAMENISCEDASHLIIARAVVILRSKGRQD